MTEFDATYDMTRSKVWKPIGETKDGFTPCVKRTYRLNHSPLVLGELSFSHFVNGDALYVFEPRFADQQHMEQLVELKHVTEL